MALPGPFSPEHIRRSKDAAPGWYSRTHLKEGIAWKAEAARRLLTKAHCGPENSVLAKVVSDRAARRRFRGAHLLGFGFGAKESEGKLTGDLAVRIYVTGKKTLGNLEKWQRIPKEINGLPTDVVPLRRPRLHALAAPGTGIRRQKAGSGVGSYGFTIENAETGKWFLVTAAHVIATDSNAGEEKTIVADHASTQVLATLSDFEPLRTDQPNSMDAAIAEISNKADILRSIPRIGPIAETQQESFLYQSVRKFGAITNHTLGVVVDGLSSLPLGPFVYDGLVCVKGCEVHFSEQGDSGSVVVDAISHRPIGLITGGAGYETFITPIHRILTRFPGKIVS
jgi:hypothetical protein